MSIRISVPTKTRDHWSGYEVDTTISFDLSVSEARALVQSINAQIPAEQERQERDRRAEVQQLEARLRTLKGTAA
ncbi:hypothetical protein BX589_102350 [Paraburkholderia fungorum]|uniref:hypothetical protein n=1 Tax=Paraburkholderia fungorum TaxID=134537 RepID=UPI000D3F3435|nr:hypothetical protein [Paraburkholderia fungorum]PRZ56149.1 hypothetical protein BX589_102350 [Paraburkholderia fungorum]